MSISLDLGIKETQKDIENLVKSLKILNDNIKSVNQSIGSVKNYKDREKASENLKKINNQLDNSEKQLISTINTHVKSINDAKRVNRELRKIRNQVDQTTKQGREEVKKLSEAIDKNNKFLTKNGTAIEKLRSKVGGYRKSIIQATTQLFGMSVAFNALRNTISKVFTLNIDIEKQQVKLANVLGVTTAETTKLADESARLGSETEKSESEVIALQISLAKLGFTQSKIIASTEGIINASIGLDESLEGTATLVAKTINAYGLLASDSSKVGDILLKSTATTALGFSELTTSLANVAGAASATDVSLERTVATLGVLVDNTLDASTAGNSLKKIYLTLAKEGKTLNQALEEINSSQNKAAKSTELFGLTASTAGLILSNNIERVSDLSKQFENSEGTSKRMAEAFQNTASGALAQMNSAFEGLLSSVNGTNGLVVKFAKTMSSFFNFLKNNLDTIWAVTKAVLTFAGAFVLVKKVLLPLMGILPKLGTFFVSVASKTKIATISLKGFRTALAGSTLGLTLIVGLVIELISAFTGLQASSKKLNNSLEEVDLGLDKLNNELDGIGDKKEAVKTIEALGDKSKLTAVETDKLAKANKLLRPDLEGAGVSADTLSTKLTTLSLNYENASETAIALFKAQNRKKYDDIAKGIKGTSKELEKYNILLDNDIQPGFYITLFQGTKKLSDNEKELQKVNDKILTLNDTQTKGLKSIIDFSGGLEEAKKQYPDIITQLDSYVATLEKVDIKTKSNTENNIENNIAVVENKKETVAKLIIEDKKRVLSNKQALTEILNNEELSSEERKVAIFDLNQSIFDANDERLKDEISKLNETIALAKGEDLIKAINDRVNKEIELEDNKQKKINTLRDASVKKEKERNEESLERLEVMVDEVDAITTRQAEDLAEKDKARLEKKQEDADKEIFILEQTAIIAKGIADNLFEAEKIRSQERIDILNKEANDEIERINNSTLSEEQKETKIKEIRAKSNKAIADEKRKQFNIEKTADIVQVGIQTLVAVAKVTAQTGILAPTVIPFIITAGGIQAGLIAGKPNPYFTGTTNAKEGLAVVGEKGREIIQNSKGESFLTPSVATFTQLTGGETILNNRDTEKSLEVNNVSYLNDAKVIQLLEILNNKESVVHTSSITEGGIVAVTRSKSGIQTIINDYF